MSLSKKDVEHVAALARLQIADGEKETLAAELNRILDYAVELQKLDLKDVPITTHANLTGTVTRPDTPEPSLSAEATLANAPDKEASQFRVPAVLEG